MTVSVNISDAATMSPREIEALQAMLSALGGSECIKKVTVGDVSVEYTAQPVHKTEHDSPLHGQTAHSFIVDEIPMPTEQEDDIDTPLPIEDDIRPTEQAIDFAALFGNSIPPAPVSAI